MRYYLSLLLLLLIPTASGAEPSQASIEKLLALTTANRASINVLSDVDKIVESTVDSQLAGEKLSPEAQKLAASTKTTIHETFQKALGWEAVKPWYMKAYADAFTQAEINELIQFFESSAGTKFIKQMPEVEKSTTAKYQQQLAVMLQLLQSSLPQLIKNVKTANKSE